MADTNVHFFNGTFMIFATHDFSVNNTGFLMKDWCAFSVSETHRRRTRILCIAGCPSPPHPPPSALLTTAQLCGAC